MILWVLDNVNPGPPPAGQFLMVTTDATGTFTTTFTGSGGGAALPAQIELTDMALDVLAGPQTVAAVSCTQPLPPDLAVTATVAAASVHVGDAIPYTVTVSNLGAGAAHNVRLNDLVMGPGVVTSITPGCVFAPPSCLFGTIAPGEARTVTVAVTTNGPGVVQSTMNVTTTDPEPNLANNSASASPVTVSLPTPPPPPPPPPPPGCSAVSDVSGSGTFALADGTTVSVLVRASCVYDRRSNTFAVGQSRVTIQGSGGRPCVDAKTNGSSADVATFAGNGPDATVAGTYGGVPFAVTLHDGGVGNPQLDTIRVVSGSFTTDGSTPSNLAVQIDD
jgi:uncharacterized repeat protein (TIGR01451 family)